MTKKFQKTNSKKAQAFSVDIIIVIVVVLFGILILVLTQINETEGESSIEERYDRAALDAHIIFENLKEKGIVQHSDNSVDAHELLTINDEDMRGELGISGKFCIVLERDGKLVKIDSQSSVNGVGSEDIIVNEEPCLSQ